MSSLPSANPYQRTSISCTGSPLAEISTTVIAVGFWAASGHTPADGADNAPTGGDGAEEPADARSRLVLGPGGAELMTAAGLDLFGALDREDATGRAGEVVVVPVGEQGRGAGSPDGEVDLQTVYLVGLGDASNTAHRRAGAALARRTKGLATVCSTVTATAEPSAVQAFVEGSILATFRYRAPGSAPLPEDALPLGELVLVDTTGAVAEAARRGERVGAAGWLARTLVHTPSNQKDPQWLAEQAEEVARRAGRLRAKVRTERTLATEGFGGLLGVGQGSDRPPRLIELSYVPVEVTTRTPHVVLVGKGITYDTGGLSLKPRESMVPMKTDMSGGAVVIGVLSALADLEVPVRVTGLVAAAENMPGAAAQRPGDVLSQYDGTSVEVLNTDAEGRLVLADAMSYAVAELDATVLVDVATLTGAATMGLGRQYAALFSSDDALARALVDAGSAAGEQLWQLPLVEDYRSALDSDVADIAHIPTTKVGGGAITAALFLQRFAGELPWAHLDIAGPGRADADAHEIVKGGTAFGTRALLYWLADGAPAVRGPR
ncbi:MAG TPA: leucyl aminopeptidase [Jiangellaceae bacterium]|nr:leucyl aminopeptidase [Jiangellaceae bacterium]